MSISSGRAKLMTSLKELNVRWSKVAPLWDDQVRKGFEKEFLEPLDGKVRSAVTAMEEMHDLLTKAQEGLRVTDHRPEDLSGQFTNRQRDLLRTLESLAAARVASVKHTDETFEHDEAAGRRAHEEACAAIEEEYKTAKADAQAAFREATRRAKADLAASLRDTKRTGARERDSILAKAKSNQAESKKKLDEAIWLAETVYEATENQPQERFDEKRKAIGARRGGLRSIVDHASRRMRRYHIKGPPDLTADPSVPLPVAGGVDDEATPEPSAAAAAPIAAAPMTAEAAEAHVEECTAAASAQLERLGRLPIAHLFRGHLLPMLSILAVIGAGLYVAWKQDWTFDARVGIVTGVAAVLLTGLTIGLYFVARGQTHKVLRPLAETVRAGLRSCDEWQAVAARTQAAEEAALIETRDREIAEARAKFAPINAEIEQRRDKHLDRIEREYPEKLAALEAAGAQTLVELKEAYDAEREAIDRRYEDGKTERQAAYETATRDRARRRDEAWAALERDWKEGMERCAAAVDAIERESARLFPPWNDASWDRWTPPTEFSPSVRFGELAIDRALIDGGIPTEPRLRIATPERFVLPATLDFPDDCSLLLLAGADGREAAVDTLQTTMLRLLTALPPGKVRFTIIDPVGLGQNFAGFMHLADYDDAFVASRIWTEGRHIEQRLADLSEHMETVIQKYLRNEFETIADYNEQAGEIAEPYRFLVIADFPTNFSETAARRLLSIASSGPRCGVYTLISVDRRQPLPQGIDLGDLERHSTTLVYEPASSAGAAPGSAGAGDAESEAGTGGVPDAHDVPVEERAARFVWKDTTFNKWPLALDPPPSEDFVTDKLNLVGEASRDATRVEVPFATISPSEGEYWSRDCTKTLAVPLGRSGATKLQQIEIGAGTSQHALIAGKTGSGKSTLLHVLVTNLALWYSPDEVQFYLIDFKKGVEFKTYATHRLPHARAVAVESDREFGVSVLQRVDDELKRRGEIYRELGVQDLAGYRAAGQDEAMPRILLIIDEFQEMFTEDDKLGQDAALLLDRLVRQGRAFGVHCLLGSQTLGGAYTLARSTMGQMQVRIALQCSEADSYLIMSDDNSAARLLARPGEAIYNDSGGAVEGNNPFQICWLPEAEREEQLKRAEALAIHRKYRRASPLIVFEGNAPADADGNHLLADLLDRPGWATAADGAPVLAPARTWFGEAIAIKDPTAAIFRRQSGSNVLIVGQQEETALALTATALVSIAAHCAPDLDGGGAAGATGATGAKIYVFDGCPVDSPHAGYLDRAAAVLPHDVRVVKWREVEPAMQEIAEELARRRADDLTDAPPVFLLIYGLHRFRMLRTKDEFGLSMGGDDEPMSADAQFAELLRDGAPYGMHTMTWCDTATNLNRTLDRSGLREFEMRILFQMSGVDSTQLIDSPLAAKLGMRRALYFNEEEGVLEKFRPYALPDDAWLGEVRERLARKAGAPQH